MNNKVNKFTPNGGNVSLGSFRKEGKLHAQWSLVDLSDGREIAIIRTYWPASKCYACAWVHGREGGNDYSNGRGSAGGGGYCKQSAAIAEALNHCGFGFDRYFGGAGLTAVDDALRAIAHHFGLRSRFAIIKAHG